MEHAVRFLRTLIRAPGATGAIAPSSRWLAEKMVEVIPDGDGVVVVEFGPGTGSFTGLIDQRVGSRGRFFAVEVDPEFAAHTAARYPQVTVRHDSVTNIERLCREEGVERIDCVISGLPWANFPPELQDEILDAMLSVMCPGGVFTTFAYVHSLGLPRARAFRRRLHESFSRVELTYPIVRNLPPAVCYRCIV